MVSALGGYARLLERKGGYRSQGTKSTIAES